MTEKNNNSLMYICHKGKSHFALPILNFLSQKIKLYRSESKYGFIHKIRLKNNKIIFVTGGTSWEIPVIIGLSGKLPFMQLGHSIPFIVFVL